MNKLNTFEATYTRYPFAPLVALGIAIAAVLKTKLGSNESKSKAGHGHGIDSGAQLAA